MHDFYAAMRSGAGIHTSQISMGEYEDFFGAILAEGRDVLHLAFSSGLTGSINSARMAAERLAGQYPERKLYIVDSLAASSGYGLLLDALADRRDAGMSMEELRSWTEENRLRLNHWFFSTDLSYYFRGGRITRTEAWVGGVLDICPMLNMNCEGRLIPRAKNRGLKRSIKDAVARMAESADGGEEYSGKCFLSHSDMGETAAAVAEAIEARFPRLDGRVRIFDIGTVIGSHTGPGTVSIYFWGKERGE